MVLIALTVGNIDLGQLVDSVANANPALLLAALAIYYVGFPLRGYRWLLLLRGAGTKVSLRDSTEIIFISWLVNCLVPAKLGDVYRAYLLRLNLDVSLSRTFGTVFIERVLDLFAIVLLGLAAGFWSFRNGMSRRGPDRVRHRARVRGRAGDRVVQRAQLRQPASSAGCRCPIASSSSTTASRRGSSRSTLVACRR